MSATMTALHESGHAVVAFVLDLGITEATVVRSGKNLGLVRFRDSNATFERDPDRTQRLLVATLAGRAAVARSFVNPGYGCEEDDQRVWDMARRLVGSDPNHAHEVALAVKEAWAEAQGLVQDYSQAIADLARDLELFGVLRGEALNTRVAEAVERDRASPHQQRQRERRQKFWRWMEEQEGANDANHDYHQGGQPRDIGLCKCRGGRRSRSGRRESRLDASRSRMDGGRGGQGRGASQLS